MRRTTIEIDEDLLERARRGLGTTTMRATVEEALRRAADKVETEFEERRARQLDDLRTLGDHLNLEVLASDEMWR